MSKLFQTCRLRVALGIDVHSNQTIKDSVKDNGVSAECQAGEQYGDTGMSWSPPLRRAVSKYGSWALNLAWEGLG